MCETYEMPEKTEYDMVKKIKKHLNNIDRNKLYNEKRAEHIQKTRQKYLPLLTDILLEKIGEKRKLRKSRFLKEYKNQFTTRIVHKNTVWK